MRILIWLFLLSTPLLAMDVVCIHGFMRTKNCMKPLGKKLEEAGHTPHLWGYRSQKYTIEELAEQLVCYLKQEAKGEPISFVTHSLGGLIVRAALNHPECPKEAKQGQIILLAPPNGGSKTARFLKSIPLVCSIFGDKAGEQLLTSYREDFDNLGSLPSSTIVIAGRRDWKVSIEETHLSSPHKHHIIGCGHCYIMRNKEAFSLILAAFEKFS